MRLIVPMLIAVIAPASAAADPPADSDDAIIRRLIESLSDPDAEVRQNLAVALAKFGPSAVAPLTEALKDAEPYRRSGAAYALGLIGVPARSALPALLNALSDSEPEVRRQASFAIGRLIPQRDPARPQTPTYRGALP